MAEQDDRRQLAALTFTRLISTHFYTSNLDKLLQARRHFANRGYDLKFFRGKHDPYDEDYDLGTRGLLRRAVEQVNEEFGIKSMFFVEDTSLRIDALSQQLDFPGVALKEWFAGITFDQLDAELRRTGNNRRATAKSDIALYVPSLGVPLYFHGEVSGVVADTPPTFSASISDPWLTPNNFGGWFIPDQAAKRFGEMNYEESLRYDFRSRALDDLIDYIENLHAGLNLHQSFYTVQRPSSSQDSQPSLFPLDHPVLLLVTGYKCAGKTTFLQYLGRREEVLTIEGSRLIRAIAARTRAPLNNAADALSFLERHGWHAVSSEIGDFIDLRGPKVCVVSGCRTPEDIRYLKARFPGAQNVLIEADVRLRFERHLARGREPDIGTIESFAATDEEQNSFGLMRVGRELADTIIRNEGDLNEFQRSIDQLAENQNPRSTTSASPLQKALHMLARLGGAGTLGELLEAKESLQRMSRSTLRKLLVSIPEFVRVESRNAGSIYTLLPRGYTLLEILDERVAASLARSEDLRDQA